ncbi:MAG: hypothetical protein H7A46_25665 [Verrucomicrobiales bacterium]|nr:hypothetical protein [Verrucomicrobiales bacterium]
MTETTTMIHTYKHTFRNGVKATATFRLDPPSFDVEWEGKTSRALIPEYCRWRHSILEDIARRTGQRIAVVDVT